MQSRGLQAVMATNAANGATILQLYKPRDLLQFNLIIAPCCLWQLYWLAILHEPDCVQHALKHCILSPSFSDVQNNPTILPVHKHLIL